jgi:hypothetical protein
VRPAASAPCRPDRQSARYRGDRRVQHQQRRPGPVHRRRGGHRLQPRGLHPRSLALPRILDVPHFASRSLADYRRVLTQKGTLVPASNTRNRWIGGFSRVLPARLMAPFVSQRIRAPEMAPNQADLVALAELMESGKLSPVIDRTYPLAEVPEAPSLFRGGTHPREDRHHHVKRDSLSPTHERLRRPGSSLGISRPVPWAWACWGRLRRPRHRPGGQC